MENEKMKNWKLTTAIAVTAVATAALAFLYGKDEDKTEQPGQEKKAEISWDFLPEVIATYGDKKITRDEFVGLIKEISSSFPGGPSSENLNPDVIKAIAPQIAKTMIDKKILLDMAEADGIKPSPELFAQEFDESMKSAPQDKIAQFKEALATEGKTIESYRDELAKTPIAQEDTAINRWIKTKVSASISVPEEEAKKYYDEHQDSFTKDESVNASHILIKSKSGSEEDMDAAKKRCGEIKSDIDGGKTSFEKAAEEFSDCPSGKSAKGNLGEFGRGKMIKEFEDVAFAMKTGELSDPVKTIHGYHIIKLLGHSDKTTTPYAEVGGKISDYLKQDQVERKVKDMLDKKKAELNVKINLPESKMPTMPMLPPESIQNAEPEQAPAKEGK